MRRWEYITSSYEGLKIDRAFDEHGARWSIRAGESLIADLQKALKGERIEFLVEYH